MGWRVLIERPVLITVAMAGKASFAAIGGVTRAYKSIIEYTKHFKVYLILPPTIGARVDIMSLKNELGVHEVIPLRTSVRPLLTSDRLGFVYFYIPHQILKHMIRGLERVKVEPSAVVVLNEPPEYLTIGSFLGERLNVPAMALLQLPVFYHDVRRRQNIAQALHLWYKELYRDEGLSRFTRWLRARVELMARHSRFAKNVLKNYDILVAISKSIPVEMGPEWTNKIHALDPGISFSKEEQELLYKARITTKKEDHVIVGGRVDALKGFVESLYAFKEIARQIPSIKLTVTGFVSRELEARINKFIRRLGLEGRVILTGLLPWFERLKLVASAKLMLYPSHVDGYPYAVAESLYLNTPVVAYDIPPIRIYHGDNPGVKLVREGDIEALATEALNVLNSKDTIPNQPKLKTWEDIMREEVEFVYKLLGKWY